MKKKEFIYMLLVLAAVAIRLAFFDYETLDYVNFLSQWVQYFRDNGGFAALKDSIGNYNIPYLYFLALFSYIPVNDMYLIKILSCCFDFLLARSCAKIAEHCGGRGDIAFFAVLFLPTVVINGSLWAQCDSIYTALAFMGLALALDPERKKYTPAVSMALFALSFGFKLQSVFILPVCVILLIAGRYRLRHFIVFPVTYVITILPAVILGRPFKDALLLYFDQANSVGTAPNYNSPSLTALDQSVSSVTPYVPTILIDADPDTGSGSYYQSENRLSPDKKVIYTAENDTTFKLPVVADSVLSVTGTYTSWSYYQGVLTFSAPVSGSITVKYRKTNSDAYDSIMNCSSAVVYSPITIVMAGCPAQPNAYFWNSNDSISMNPGYFPMETYNLAGDSGDPITGFGMQQNSLVIFKERSVGKTLFGTATIDERDYIDLPYTAINSSVGCLPNTVQLIGNNLVWANSKGIYYLTDTTDAGENNTELISRKLGETVFSNAVCSYDDGSRYYFICSNGEAWVWDYSISSYKDPSWFYLTNIKAVAFCGENFITNDGYICKLTDSFSDFGSAIQKSYRFATHNFGGYDRIVNVNSVVISIRNDSNSVTELCYITDKEKRTDQADLVNVAWLLTPRNLSFRCLAGRRFAKVFRRRPRCRRIHHFTMELANSNLGEDLSIVSAAIYFYYEGRMKYNP